MTQRDLFDHSVREPLAQPVASARKSDPPSSHEAAARVEERGVAGRQRQQVIDAVWKWPGKTSKELAELDGELDRYQFGRRLPEAEAMKEIHRRQDGSSELRWWPGEKT